MLKYQGGGFIPGVPARDLTAEESKRFNEAKLIKSGLYKRDQVIQEKKEVAYKAKENKKWQA